MTAAQSADTSNHIPDSELTEKQQAIYEYLIEYAASYNFVKARQIADELGMDSREVGANLPAVIDADGPLDIEAWGGENNANTWKVTLNDDG